MYKVKYNRHEYRSEYLKSEEWKKLRDAVLDAECDCQICQSRKASEVHHLVYRNLVDIKISDLLPICRDCHTYVHQAIDDSWISQREDDIDNIRIKTVGILVDAEYKVYREWLYAKQYIPVDVVAQINELKLNNFVIKRLAGIVKKQVWYDNLDKIKITGRQLEQLSDVIRVATFRAKQKVESERKASVRFIQKRMSFPSGIKRIYTDDEVALISESPKHIINKAVGGRMKNWRDTIRVIKQPVELIDTVLDMVRKRVRRLANKSERRALKTYSSKYYKVDPNKRF